MRKVKLISDGTVPGTKLLNEDGHLIPGVMRIEIEPIDAKNPGLTRIKATLISDLEIDGEIVSIDAKEGITNSKGEIKDAKHFLRKESSPGIVAEIQRVPHGRLTDIDRRFPYDPYVSGGGSGAGGPAGAPVLADGASGGSAGSNPNGPPAGGGKQGGPR